MAITLGDWRALCEMRNLDARGAFLLCWLRFATIRPSRLLGYWVILPFCVVVHPSDRTSVGPEWLRLKCGPTLRDASFVLTSILGMHFWAIGYSIALSDSWFSGFILRRSVEIE